MNNTYHGIVEIPGIKKFVIGDLLFAELTCAVSEEYTHSWSHYDQIIYILSGKKEVQSPSGKFSIEKGNAIFFKKGARAAKQFFDEDFCFMTFYITDNFIREVIGEITECENTKPSIKVTEVTNIKLEIDFALSSFFESMKAYFSANEKPKETLLRLKLKELIAGILLGDSNQNLADYFQSLSHCKAPSIKETMELNFLQQLSLSEYAELCHRSLSSFKRDFQNQFNDSPSRWIFQRRLEYSTSLLRGSEKSISTIAHDSGFGDLAHFSRAFKTKFGVTPSTFRKNLIN